MKATEFRKLIREEVRRALKEEDITSAPETIGIKDATGRSVIATITKTSTGSQIEKPGMWKYSYAGSPMDLVVSLFMSRAVYTKSGKYLETSEDAVSNLLKKAPRFKKVN